MQKAPTYLIATFIFNTAIAGVLKILMPQALFWVNFIYSQCIGLSVLAINLLVMFYVKGGVIRWAIFSIALPLSVALGLTLAFMLTGMGSWSDSFAWSSMVIGLFFGLIGAVAALLYERIGIETRHRHLIQSEGEKRHLEAHLKLLQAQIEPHFLFNSLANVSSLIETDPVLARRLLERLIDWLRIALARARSDSATLDDELDMLENYLQILKIRFGERLCWNMEVHEDARLAVFPPMLLQPLVENAVRHGIEPKLGGGRLQIKAHTDAQRLTVCVHDDGVGFSADAQFGAGLENVHARLTALYGADGKLRLESNAEGGMTVTLEIPRCVR